MDLEAQNNRILDLGVDDVHVPAPGGLKRKKTMATLPTKTRNALPRQEFADPSERKYPIHDKAHSDNAAARLEQQKASMTPAKYSQIKARIRAAQKRFGEKPKASRMSPGKGLRMRINTNTGEVHVRHMAEVVGGRLVKFASMVELDQKLLDDSGKPVWIQIAKLGTFAGHPTGPFELSGDTFAEIVRNFKATQNRRVAIDFEHASEQDPTDGAIPTHGAPAQGWILDLVNRATDGLWGLVEWLEPARDYIKQGKYRFFSPAIRFNSRDRVTGKPVGARLTSGALTNAPFLDGMVPLVARDFDKEPERDDELVTLSMSGTHCYSAHDYLPALRSAMGVNHLAGPHELSDALGRFRDMFDEAGGDGTATVHGVNLAQYLPAMRDTAQMPIGSTWAEMFDAVEAMIDQAIEQHEEEFHAGDEPDATTATDNEEDMTMADKEITVQLTEAHGKVAELTLKLKDADTELTTLRAEKTAREENDIKEEVGLAFDTYKDTKKLTLTDKESMVVFRTTAPDAFRKMYPKVPAGQRHLAKTLVLDDKRQDAEELDEEVVSLADLANKYRAEGKTNEEAVALAFTEHRKLVAVARTH